MIIILKIINLLFSSRDNILFKPERQIKIYHKTNGKICCIPGAWVRVKIRKEKQRLNKQKRINTVAGFLFLINILVIPSIKNGIVYPPTDFKKNKTEFRKGAEYAE